MTVNMTVKPRDILVGDLIHHDNKVARVKNITEYWDGRYTFVVNCVRGNYSYIYKCSESDTVTLLSI